MKKNEKLSDGVLVDWLKNLIRSSVEEAIDERLDALGLSCKVFRVKDLAYRYKHSLSWVTKHPWMMPNYGKYALSGSRKWTLEELERWEKIPIEKRIEDFKKKVLEESKLMFDSRRA